MSLASRFALYQQIERHRRRPLIIYVTNERGGVPGQIAGDVLPEIMDQLGRLDSGTQELDFLIVSNGGDPTVAFRIMTLIRERVKKVAVIIPQAAYSAATLFALGADEIIMHANGNLGPVDPQIHVPTEKGEKYFGSQDVTAFFDFVRNEVGVTDQQHVSALLQKLCSELGPVSLGLQARASQLSVSLGGEVTQVTHDH